MRKPSKMPSAKKSRGKKREKEKNEDKEAVEKEPEGSFAWKVLVPSKVRKLMQCESPEELQILMSATLNFDQHEVDLKQASQLDCFVIAFHWATQHGFDERQLSGFITLLSTILKNIEENHMTKSDNLHFLKECFSGVGSDRPDVVPIPLYFFKLEHAKLIMEYLLTTLFHQYSLYEFLYSQEQDELVIGTDLCTEVCSEISGPFPPPLEEGMPLEIYESFLLSQTKEDSAEDLEGDLIDEDEMTEAVMAAVQSSGDEVVKTVPASELRKIIERVTKELILPARLDLRKRIREKEAAYIARIEKIPAK